VYETCPRDEEGENEDDSSEFKTVLVCGYPYGGDDYGQDLKIHSNADAEAVQFAGARGGVRLSWTERMLRRVCVYGSQKGDDRDDKEQGQT
jgi:hypothetical protein